MKHELVTLPKNRAHGGSLPNTGPITINFRAVKDVAHSLVIETTTFVFTAVDASFIVLLNPYGCVIDGEYHLEQRAFYRVLSPRSRHIPTNQWQEVVRIDLPPGAKASYEMRS